MIRFFKLIKRLLCSSLLTLPAIPASSHSPLFTLFQEHERWPKDIVVERIEQRPIHCDEVLAAKEAFLMSSSLMVMPIISWNGSKIGDGMSGQSAIAFSLLLERDRKPKEGSTQHIEIPYGAVTGMRSQLF